MSQLSELAPKRSERIIDLVKAAGVDVSDWAKFKGGEKRAASNPKYCYEWSFVEPGKVVVLNLWLNAMEERGGKILCDLNMRKAIRRGGNVSNSVRQKRSVEMDRAIQKALAENLRIRIVVCDGERRGHDDARVSRVYKRLLDPMPWSVAAYDHKSGECTLSRGAYGERFVDQFSIQEELAEPPERRTVLADVFQRNPEVRRRVLVRACGRCEWCRQPGFAMADGRIFLETHHVIPLGEGGADTANNVAALCPNHHREAHHGLIRDEIQKKLLARLNAKQSAN